ncbi:putative ribonuclease H-like domain-containing protein [Tanacetum coccineum]
MNQICGMKGIKREFSVARTPQKIGVAERKNMTLIEAVRTMLADSLLPTTFWAEAVNTACYVQNRVLVTKPHNKIPYELLLGRPPSISFMRPFGYPVTILNTLDPLGKFDGKADEGFLVRYSINSKAFRVFNSRTRKPVTAGNQTNGEAGIETNVNAGQAGHEKASDNEYILLPLMLSNSPLSSSTQSTDDKDVDEVPDKGDDDVSQRNGQEKERGASNKEDDQHVQDFRTELDSLLVQQKEGYANITNSDSTASLYVSTVGPSINTASENINTGSPNTNTASPIPNDSSMQSLENIGIFDDAYDDKEAGAEADLNNLETTMNASHIPTTRIHKDHPIDQIIGDINSASQTRRMTNISKEHVMTLVDLPKGKRAIGTKWVYRNKKDERGIVVKNKARLVAQGYTQGEGIDYDEVFDPVDRIEANRFQVTPKISHLHAVKRIFRYLKGKHNLGLWYPRDSPFDLEAFSDSNYARASLYRKSTTGVALIEGRMIAIDWRCFLDKIKVNTGISKISTARIGKAIWLDLTATVITVDNGEQEINATVDGKEFTITEASVRRHLQLADADGISVLPNTEIFDQHTLMGYVLTDDKLTFQKGFSGEHIPLFPSMLALQAEEGEGSGNPSKPQPPPSTAQPTHEEPIPNIESSSPQKTQSPRQALNKDTELPQTSVPIPNVPDEVVNQERSDSVERAATTATSLEVMQDSSAKRPWGVPLFKLGLKGHLNCPMIHHSGRVLALEIDLRQTNKVYGTAYTKLIMKVKKLEKTVKPIQARIRAKIVDSDDDMALEDSSKQGRMIEEIDQDVGVTLFTLKVEERSSRRAISTGSGGVSTASRIVSTAGMIQQVNIIIPLSSATKDKGKAIMTESEPEQTTTKLK